jgi:hypothetical protein
MRSRLAIVITAVVVVAVAALILSRGTLSKRVYDREGGKLAEKMSPKLQEKYGEELSYTLDKFWSCYEGDLVSQNDLTDVVEKMKRLARKDEVSDGDIFDFIGYVSHIYTEAMLEHHQKQLAE